MLNIPEGFLHDAQRQNKLISGSEKIMESKAKKKTNTQISLHVF